MNYLFLKLFNIIVSPNKYIINNKYSYNFEKNIF